MTGVVFLFSPRGIASRDVVLMCKVRCLWYLITVVLHPSSWVPVEGGNLPLVIRRRSSVCVLGPRDCKLWGPVDAFSWMFPLRQISIPCSFGAWSRPPPYSLCGDFRGGCEATKARKRRKGKRTRTVIIMERAPAPGGKGGGRRFSSYHGSLVLDHSPILEVLPGVSHLGVPLRDPV